MSQYEIPSFLVNRDTKAGYVDKVAVTDWAFGMAIGEIPFPIRMVQPVKTDKGCVFFKDSLCELHTSGLKPTEGKLSYHTLQEENTNFRKSLTWNVAKEWINARNIPVIVEINTAIGKQKMNIRLLRKIVYKGVEL